MVCLHYQLSRIGINDIFGNITACNSLLQILDYFISVCECLNLHKWNILALTAVYLTDDQILRYVYQTSGQVTGVSRTKSRIRQTLTCTMSGNEVLQYVKTFTEVRLDRKFDGVTSCIGHQSSHTCQLLDLLIRSSRTGVSHHENVVVLIQSGQQIVGQLIIGGLPGFDYFFIALLLGDQTAAVVLCNVVYSSLCICDQFRFACRHGHIGNGYGHGCSGRELVADCLDVIQSNGRLGSAVYVDNLLKDLL